MLISFLPFSEHTTEANGLEDPAKAAARIQRQEKAQKFFGTTPVAKPLLDVTNHQVGPSTSHSELSDIRTGHKNANWTLLFTVSSGLLSMYCMLIYDSFRYESR